MKLRTEVFILCVSLFFSFGGAQASIVPKLETGILRFFSENRNPTNGLIRDRARNFSPTPMDGPYRMASIASTGFGITVMANAALRGEMPKKQAEGWIKETLQYALENLEEHDGFFYHFVDWDSGKRFGGSEVSTVDTAFFIAGALYAARIFPRGEIPKFANALYERLDFIAMMTDRGKYPNRRTLTMGWTPEVGYLTYQWEDYAEHLLLLILGLGHPKSPLPKEVWRAWKRPAMKFPWMVVDIGAAGLIGANLPLFVHQYPLLFLDLRKKSDGFANYHLNSLLATLRDRYLCKNNDQYASYRAGFWGLSASGSVSGYQIYSPLFQDGTVCPSCAGASAAFLPNIVLNDMESWATGPYSSKLVGRYGFVDSFNVDPQWTDPDVIGITEGALYLSLANMTEKNSIWRDFMQIPEIQNGLSRAGFTAY